MAFLAADPNQDPNDPKNKPASQDPNSAVIGTTSPTAGTGSTTLGGTSAPIQGSGSGAGSANGSTPTSSGSFTNLQNYVTANQGNDATMGTAVGGTVKGAADNADATGGRFTWDASRNITDHTVNSDPNVINALGTLGSGGTGTVDKDAFGKQYNADYAGNGGKSDATQFDGYGNAKQAYTTTDTLGKMAAGDSSDRSQLLNKTYGTAGRQYNPGESSLDSFVLGSSDGGRKALNNINDTYGNYSSNFDRLNGSINTQAAQSAALTKTTRDTTRAAADAAIAGTSGRLDTAAAAATGKNQANTDLYGGIAKGDATALKAAGYSDDAIAAMQSDGTQYNTLVSRGTDYNAGDLDGADATNYKSLLGLVNGAGGSVADKYGAQLTASGGKDAAVDQAKVSSYNTQVATAKQIAAEAAATKKAQEQAAYDAARAASEKAAAKEIADARARNANAPNWTAPTSAGGTAVETNPDNVHIGYQDPNAPTIKSVDAGSDPTGYHPPASQPTHNDGNGNETGVQQMNFPGLVKAIAKGKYTF